MDCEHTRRKCQDSRQQGKHRFRTWLCVDCGCRFKTAEIVLYHHTADARGSVYKRDSENALARLALVEQLTPEQCRHLAALLELE